ncbi:MAG: glycoside hydrolase family 3 C-terminal domain-containing protein [Muribaculaceae bacterium]|nr:glycoside hydrolase family 3 C-terminal domain-containing protein [Muribaculaceae bacterium]
MKKISLFIFALSVAIFTANAIAPQEAPTVKSVAKQKADSLVKLLTLDEKIGLMMDRSKPVPRLGIPEYNWWNEALHGVGRAGLATVFPQSIGMGATFDPVLIEETFDIISDEARAKYNEFQKEGDNGRYKGLTFWTPNINIFRDPRWGRGQETYGEDPFLTTQLGLAAVRGLQGDDPEGLLKTMACAKHFAVHSGPEWNRHSYDAKDIQPEYLWGTYLPAFEELVNAGVGQVMCAYNRLEGEPCCGNNRLLQHILREMWDFDGIIVSDCSAIRDFYKPGNHETHKDAAEASSAAVVSGTNLECGSDYSNLKEGIERGLVSEEDINASVARLLTARFQLGEMGEDVPSCWDSIPYSVVDSPRHRQKALEVARKSMTLLKNNGVLPLSSQNKSILVMGPNAADTIMQWGNYNGTPSHTISILDGIRQKNSSVKYSQGTQHVINDGELPEVDLTGVETVIFVSGISPKLEGEEMKVDLPGFRRGDRETIELPKVQRDMIKKLKEGGKRVVLVNCSGSAIALAPEDSICDAILQAWYPGQEGGQAVADVLFGDYNPAGRLPVTFYRDDSQLPDFEDYSMAGRTYRYMKEQPLYPFGYGLSYSDFSYGDARIPASAEVGGKVPVVVNVSNDSNIDGEEVVQIYVRRKDDPSDINKSLRAFKRVEIPANSSVDVEFMLDSESFKSYDPENEEMRVIPGEYQIYYGGSSATPRSKTLKLQ